MKFFTYLGIGHTGHFCKGYYLYCNFGYQYLACKPRDKPDDPLLNPPLLEFCTSITYGQQFLERLHLWKNSFDIISDLMCYLLEDEHSLGNFNKAQAVDYIADKLQSRRLLIILLDDRKITSSGNLNDSPSVGSDKPIVLESGTPVTKAKSPSPVFANSSHIEKDTSNTVPAKTPVAPKYGGKATADGGRDSTQAIVYKDPATKHLDNDPARTPVYDNGIMQPLVGTSGKAKPIPKGNETNQVVERNHKGKVYKINKDENAMPKFTIFETYLGDEHINSKDEFAHFKAANKRLGELLIEKPELKEQLGITEIQYKHLTKKYPSQDSPFNLTWHHHQDTGKIQLVDERLHGRFGHVGGMERWGGGRKK